jgi:sterol desaturase/sphingolipid hydroxylase (fatty acid hydroxylase superfamily)
MEIIDKLTSINTNYLAYALIALFYTVEQILSSKLLSNEKKVKHLLHNIPFEIVTFIVNLFWAAVVVASIEWLNTNHIGFFYYITIPVWLKPILGVALLDLTTYWFHRMSHNVPVLWRFHRVHHSDTNMDSTTYFRAHPIEVLFWFGTSNIVASAIFGLDLITLGLYALVVTPFLVIEHIDVNLPDWLDKTLGWVFTTPNLHKVHHEQDEHFTNSNYADIFILWDRLFGTFKHKPVEQITFGLKEFDHPKKQTFWYLLKSPFVNINKDN